MPSSVSAADSAGTCIISSLPQPQSKESTHRVTFITKLLEVSLFTLLLIVAVFENTNGSVYDGDCGFIRYIFGLRILLRSCSVRTSVFESLRYGLIGVLTLRYLWSVRGLCGSIRHGTRLLREHLGCSLFLKHNSPLRLRTVR